MPELDFQIPPPRQAARLGAILWAGIAAILLPGLAAAGQLRGAEWLAQAGVMLSGAALTLTVYLGLRASNGKPLWLGFAICLIALAGAAASLLGCPRWEAQSPAARIRGSSQPS